MNPTLTVHTEASDFLRRAQWMLEQNEAENNLILGIALRLRDRPGWIVTQPYLATVDDAGGRLALAAVITPPNNLLLAGDPGGSREAMRLLVENVRAGGWTPPGINAEMELAARFAETWQQVTGQPMALKMRLRVYELREVIPPPRPAPGSLRLARLADLELVTDWRAAFFRESLHEEPPPNARELVERMISAETMYIWDNHGAVSIAASARRTTHGATINAVYTPPELRGRGYASTCVAALSQRMLDAGKSFCALFTDLDYPTSNSIYQKIGYRALCDFMEYQFSK